MTKDIETENAADRSIIHESASMVDLLKLVERVARTRASVLVQGESGTGKELIAKSIHRLSPRKDKPFVAVNCGAISETLAENELFGHKKGAYTGAAETTRGLFEMADGGTLFLDEIGEMPLALQPKLLRVLQEGEIELLGGGDSVDVDVRIVCATNRDLKACVAAGTFRQDLFYRLNVFPIQVPPLRKRRRDILPLMKHFIEKYNVKEGFKIKDATQRFQECLYRYDFPGNVRELEHIILYSMTKATNPAQNQATSATLDMEDLPEYLIAEMAAPVKMITDATVMSNRIRKKLLGITHNGRPWHLTLRRTKIEDIRAFLEKQGGAWFSRKQFNASLQADADPFRNTYKTAGVFLKILKENGMLVHNGEKANRSRYRLVEDYARPCRSTS
ncbi:hypothetical protein DSCO28_41750 [Desulfosarcina ovata subsp. sediminis]|uniref:Sigma-54 factor interaction domain-containing protein n=1 Tax=Desulfosarcina ovata subsp. sediminis TaxID=885957 RepID=A0A5K7ZTR9_9BACT|nr:sigma 54-interacting transcriptional regulator [Desulfosarcina ovata]BBO83609.1 hypothetical protein DSCO28_41750 [Desulfosarcina ovata subsp. sediminis]